MSDPYRKFGMSMAEATGDYIVASAKQSDHMRAFWAGWLASILMKVDRKSGEAAIIAYRDGHKDDPDCEDGTVAALSRTEIATLRLAVPELLRNTTMDADQDLLERAALIIERIIKE